MRRVTLLKRPRIRMLFRQKELLRWLGVSIFEIWVWLVSLTVFSVLLVLKIEVGLTIVTSMDIVFTIFGED